MTNVKPGNLAMVVNAVPPWGGATCTVIRPADMSHDIGPALRQRGPFWWVEMARPMPCWTAARGVHMGVECIMPDAHLRKIGGPDVDIDTVEFNPLAHEQIV